MAIKKGSTNFSALDNLFGDSTSTTKTESQVIGKKKAALDKLDNIFGDSNTPFEPAWSPPKEPSAFQKLLSKAGSAISTGAKTVATQVSNSDFLKKKTENNTATIDKLFPNAKSNTIAQNNQNLFKVKGSEEEAKKSSLFNDPNEKEKKDPKYGWEIINTPFAMKTVTEIEDDTSDLGVKGAARIKSTAEFLGSSAVSVTNKAIYLADQAAKKIVPFYDLVDDKFIKALSVKTDLFKDNQENINNIYEKNLDAMLAKRNNPNNPEAVKFLYDLQDAGPQTLIGVALGFIPYIGPTTASGYFVSLSSAEQIKERGKVTSPLNVAIDTLGDRLLGGILSKLSRVPKKILTRALSGFATEGGTEVGQTVLKLSNDFRNADTEEERNNIFEGFKSYVTNGDMLREFGLGGVIGAGVTVGLGGISSSNVSDEAKTPSVTPKTSSPEAITAKPDVSAPSSVSVQELPNKMAGLDDIFSTFKNSLPVSNKVNTEKTLNEVSSTKAKEPNASVRLDDLIVKKEVKNDIYLEKSGDSYLFQETSLKKLVKAVKGSDSRISDENAYQKASVALKQANEAFRSGENAVQITEIGGRRLETPIRLVKAEMKGKLPEDLVANSKPGKTDKIDPEQFKYSSWSQEMESQYDAFKKVMLRFPNPKVRDKLTNGDAETFKNEVKKYGISPERVDNMLYDQTKTNHEVFDSFLDRYYSRNKPVDDLDAKFDQYYNKLKESGKTDEQLVQDLESMNIEDIWGKPEAIDNNKLDSLIKQTEEQIQKYENQAPKTEVEAPASKEVEGGEKGGQNKDFLKAKTQKEVVKEAVQEKEKTIKEVSQETGILEPNVRRILGMGAKEGTFERVDAGVYRLKKDGKDIAVIHAADSVEALPRLADSGFKADMVFLDIPYDLPSVKGGNRGIKYETISIKDFETIVDSISQIARTNDTPVVHMFSQADSSIVKMEKYNQVLFDFGFKPVAKGEWQKTFKDGSPVTNVRGQIAKPEGIILFSKSGKINKDEIPNLSFRLIRPKGYQTEKPAEMLKAIIKATTETGDTILDPFAGSGVTLAEAVKIGRMAVGIEKSENAVENFIKPRIEEAAKGEVFKKKTPGKYSRYVSQEQWTKGLSEKFGDTVKLYHQTNSDNVPDILENGFKSNGEFGDDVFFVMEEKIDRVGGKGSDYLVVEVPKSHYDRLFPDERSMNDIFSDKESELDGDTKEEIMRSYILNDKTSTGFDILMNADEIKPEWIKRAKYNPFEKKKANVIESKQNPFKAKDKETRFDYLNMTPEEARVELYKMFPKNDVKLIGRELGSVETNGDIFGKDIRGNYVVGDGVINVVMNDGRVNDRTVYHEAFHHYLNTYHPFIDKGNLVNSYYRAHRAELDAKYGDYAQDMRGEEALADWFADYRAGRMTFTGKIQALFDKIVRHIKGLIGRLDGNDKIIKTFEQVIASEAKTMDKKQIFSNDRVIFNKKAKLKPSDLSSQEHKALEGAINKISEINTKVTVPKHIIASLPFWNDKAALFMSRETMERNLDDIAGSFSPEIKEFLTEKVTANETMRAVFATTLREKIETDIVERLGIKKGSPLSALVQKFGEGEISQKELMEKTDKWAQVIEASEYLRNVYDNMLDMWNGVRKSFNYEPVPKRKDYFRHGNFISSFDSIGIILKANDLPTSISGRTYMFKPGTPFSTAALKRMGVKTDYDAVGGIDNYINAVSRSIFHTDSVQRGRSMESVIGKGSEIIESENLEIRKRNQERIDQNSNEQMEPEIPEINLPNFQANLIEWTNLLAGKKSLLDRGGESTAGRRLYTVVNWLRSRVAANMIGGNISSAMTNFIPVTQLLATTNKISAARGLAEVPRGIADSRLIDGQISGFLSRRFMKEQIGMSPWDKTKAGLNYMFKAVDLFTSRWVVASKYYENVSKGMPKAKALKDADNYAGKVITDRSIGQLPNIFGSKTLGIFTQFQTEVNNQWSFITKDMPMMSKDNKLKLISTFIQFFLYSYLFNELYEKLIGRRPAIDPIYDAMTLAGQTVEGKNKPFAKRTGLALESFAGNLPGVGGITGGRYPLFAGFPDILGTLKGEKDINKGLISPAYYLAFPVAGGQVKKTYEGLTAYNEGGSFSRAGLLQFPIDQTSENLIKTGIFGKYSTEDSKLYFGEERSPLGKNQTKEYRRLLDYNPTQARAFYDRIIDKREKKRDN